jgi:hypothetical protein
MLIICQFSFYDRVNINVNCYSDNEHARLLIVSDDLLLLNAKVLDIYPIF